MIFAKLSKHKVSILNNKEWCQMFLAYFAFIRFLLNIKMDSL